MTRERFDQELGRLRDEILLLGGEVNRNLVRSGNVLYRRDQQAAQELIDADKWVNDHRIRIGQDALKLIATQQPMAVDMRFVASVMEIAGELERIHDYIKGIGKICLTLNSYQVPAELLTNLPRMAELSGDMLHDALKAFERRDADMARSIPPRDDQVDTLFNDEYRRLVQYVKEHPEKIDLANRIEWAGHNLERSADRVINICEWIVYLVTGNYVEVESEYEAPPMTSE